MLTPELVEILRAPISEESPCGSDLEYDPDFIALETASKGKPEQQFGDTVIPAEEPEWRQIAEQAVSVLQRTKDVRVAVLLLRACTRVQGLSGFLMALEVLTTFIDRDWDGLHPALDADDDNDPTMRLNALAALSDDQFLVRDLLEARIGLSRSLGTLRVSDVSAIRSHGATGEGQYSSSQVDGALQEISREHPEVLEQMQAISPDVMRLQSLLIERSNRSDAADFSRLRTLGGYLQQAARNLAGEPREANTANAETRSEDTTTGASQLLVIRGDIHTREDALQMLDRVISYLQRTEPGNPAPLLIERAKKLIGVSFLDIIANLAPDAMSTIENVTGARPIED